MIPYDDLVIALQTWRAKKGLPISQMSGSIAPPPPPAAVAVAPASSPGSGPGRAAPPAPPPPRPPARPMSQIPTDEVEPATDAIDHLAPAAHAGHDHETLDHDAPELEEHHDGAGLEHADGHEPVGEHHYQNEGDDFAMAFANLEAPAEGGDESTSIGSPPAPASGAGRGDATLPRNGGGGRNEDW